VVLHCGDRTVRISRSAEAMLETIAGRPSMDRIEAMLWHAARQTAARPLLAGITAEAFPRRGPAGRVIEVLLLLSGERSPSLRADAMTPAEELLSPRQRLVARFIASGNTVRETADALDSRPETVRRHLKLVYERLGVSDRASLSRLVNP
jgi:DNA-binding NarL/FixJ family response regulator